jgi:ferrous iron transport protein A
VPSLVGDRGHTPGTKVFLTEVEENVVRLCEVPAGGRVVVRSIDEGSAGRRLQDVGFVRGTIVEVERRAPLGDPTLYDVRGSRIALRRDAAAHIEVDVLARRDSHDG